MNDSKLTREAKKAAILDLLETAPEPYNSGEICNILGMFDQIEIEDGEADAILYELEAEGKAIKGEMLPRHFFWIGAADPK